MSARFVVEPDAAAVDAAAVARRRAGLPCQGGFDLSGPHDHTGRDTTCAGVVDDVETARAALRAAARGAELIVAVGPGLDPDVARRFRRDLSRLGAVEEGGTVADDAEVVLTAEQRQLLELLAQGASIPSAAAELFVSVRTAERRVAQARAALGVRTTAAAVVAWERGAR